MFCHYIVFSSAGLSVFVVIIVKSKEGRFYNGKTCSPHRFQSYGVFLFP